MFCLHRRTAYQDKLDTTSTKLVRCTAYRRSNNWKIIKSTQQVRKKVQQQSTPYKSRNYCILSTYFFHTYFTMFSYQVSYFWVVHGHPHIFSYFWGVYDRPCIFFIFVSIRWLSYFFFFFWGGGGRGVQLMFAKDTSLLCRASYNTKLHKASNQR